VAWSAGTVQQPESRSPNLQLPCVVWPKRLFSCEAHSDLDPLSNVDTIYPLNDLQMEQLSGGDPKEERRIRLLQMELAVRAVQYPKSMPVKITFEHWRQLLTLSRNGQQKYLLTLIKKQGGNTKEKSKKITLNEDAAEYHDIDYEHNVFEHKLFRNSLTPMIHPNTVSAALNSRLLDVSS